MDDIGRIYPPQETEISDVESAKKLIDGASREYLLSFLFQAQKDGLLRILSGTDGQTTEALRRRCHAAVDNLFQDCIEQENKAKNKLVVVD